MMPTPKSNIVLYTVFINVAVHDMVKACRPIYAALWLFVRSKRSSKLALAQKSVLFLRSEQQNHYFGKLCADHRCLIISHVRVS